MSTNTARTQLIARDVGPRKRKDRPTSDYFGMAIGISTGFGQAQSHVSRMKVEVLT